MARGPVGPTRAILLGLALLVGLVVGGRGVWAARPGRVASEPTRLIGGQPAAAQGVCPPVQNTPYLTIAYGAVTVDGAPAPVGAVVEARSPRGDTVGCIVVTTAGVYPLMQIYGEDATAAPPIPGMRAGETVAFLVDGRPATASPSLVWQADQEYHRVDLAAYTPTATNTPTPTPTNTPTNVPTNTPVPPTATYTPRPPTPTNTPTNTPVPPTDTPLPTATPVTPTDTSTPTPTDTPVPPTDTPVPTATPTDTPVPPTPTDTPTPATPEPTVAPTWPFHLYLPQILRNAGADAP